MERTRNTYMAYFSVLVYHSICVGTRRSTDIVFLKYYYTQTLKHKKRTSIFLASIPRLPKEFPGFVCLSPSSFGTGIIFLILAHPVYKM